MSIGTFGATLKFIIKDCDPITGIPDSDEGYTEEYLVSIPMRKFWILEFPLKLTKLDFFLQLEDIEITLSDQIAKLPKLNFIATWEEVAETFCEVEDTYALASMSSLEEAVQNIISFLGMQPAERSDRVLQGKSSHTLYLAGKFCFR